MAPKKDKDIVAPFIQGPSMDWTMDDGIVQPLPNMENKLQSNPGQ